MRFRFPEVFLTEWLLHKNFCVQYFVPFKSMFGECIVRNMNVHQILSTLLEGILRNPPTSLLNGCPSPSSVPSYYFLSSDQFELTNIHYTDIASHNSDNFIFKYTELTWADLHRTFKSLFSHNNVPIRKPWLLSVLIFLSLLKLHTIVEQIILIHWNRKLLGLNSFIFKLLESIC